MTDNPNRKRRPPGPNRWDDEDIPTIDENALRDDPEWLERIGNEDEDRERIVQNIEEEWGKLDEDDFVSAPVTESDNPDWTDKDYDSEPGGPEDDPYRYS